MPKKKTTKSKAAPKKSAPKTTKATGKKNIYLDYPAEGETITSQYTFRVGTPENVKRVEISVDKGPWNACRAAEGFWWLDWTPEKKGKRQVVARAEKEDGKVVTSAQRKFFADPN